MAQMECQETGNIDARQAVVEKVAAVAIYVNCRCRRLALVFLHLIKGFQYYHRSISFYFNFGKFSKLEPTPW